MIPEVFEGRKKAAFCLIEPWQFVYECDKAARGGEGIQILSKQAKGLRPIRGRRGLQAEAIGNLVSEIRQLFGICLIFGSGQFEDEIALEGIVDQKGFSHPSSAHDDH